MRCGKNFEKQNCPFRKDLHIFVQCKRGSNGYKVKNLPASGAHSHRAQLASLASLSAPRARDLIVAFRAPFLCSSHTFKFISYNLILKLKPIL